MHSETWKYRNVASVPSTRMGFWGLSPLKQSSKPIQIETRNTIKQLSFCQFLECQAPRTNPKPHHRNAKPPIENFLATVLCRTEHNVTIKWFKWYGVETFKTNCFNHQQKLLLVISSISHNRATHLHFMQCKLIFFVMDHKSHGPTGPTHAILHDIYTYIVCAWIALTICKQQTKGSPTYKWTYKYRVTQKNGHHLNLNNSWHNHSILFIFQIYQVELMF